MLEIMKTKKGLIDFKKASRNFYKLTITLTKEFSKSFEAYKKQRNTLKKT